MRWGKAAAAGGAVVGAAALVNASTARDVAPLENRLGGEADELLWRGHHVAFTRHGAGTPILLVHGLYVGASSNEWRHLIGLLAERHSVVAVDLLGFGRSDRPDLRYTPALLQALLADVMARVVRDRCAVVASSLSAAQVIAVASRDSRYIDSLALIAPTGMAQLRVESAGQSVVQLLLDAPIVGTTVYNSLSSPASLRAFLELSYADDALVSEALVEACVQNARQPGGKHAVSAFLGGRLNVDVRAALRRARQPTLLLWGDQSRLNPVQNAHAFRVLKPDADWTLISDAGDLPHDERAAPTAAAILRFIERVRTGVHSGKPTPLRGVPRLTDEGRRGGSRPR